MAYSLTVPPVKRQISYLLYLSHSPSLYMHILHDVLMYFLPSSSAISDTEVLPTTTTGSTSVGLAQVPSNGSHGALGLPGATGRQLLWSWRSWIASCSTLKLENVPALQLIYFHNFALKIPHGCRCHFLVQTVWSDLIGYSASCCHPVPGNLGLLGQGYQDAAQEIGPKHCFAYESHQNDLWAKKVHIATRCTRKGTRTTEIWWYFISNFNSCSIQFQFTYFTCEFWGSLIPGCLLSGRAPAASLAVPPGVLAELQATAMPQARTEGIPFHPQMKGNSFVKCRLRLKNS